MSQFHFVPVFKQVQGTDTNPFKYNEVMIFTSMT